MKREPAAGMRALHFQRQRYAPLPAEFQHVAALVMFKHSHTYVLCFSPPDVCAPDAIS